MNYIAGSGSSTGGEHRWKQPRALADEHEQSGVCGALERILRLFGTSEISSWSLAQPAEPPYTDPYVRWCDRESE